MRIHMLLAGVLVLLLWGCASTPDEWEKNARRAEHVAASLAVRADANSLAASALMRTQHPDIALHLIGEATAAAPDRADLAWLHVQICVLAKSCDRAPLEARLRAMDAGNAAGWMGALNRAVESGTPAEVDGALAALGRAARTEVYWTTLQSQLAPALASTHEIPLSDAFIRVIGVLAAIAVPPLRDVSSACKGELLDREERLASCRAVAAVLQRSDTYLVEMIGIAIAKRAWPPESSEARAAVEARRLYEYRSGIVSDIDSHTNWPAQANTYLQQLSRYRTEQDLFRVQIVQANRNPDPPADWTANADRSSN